jgi:hypothetical protein
MKNSINSSIESYNLTHEPKLRNLVTQRDTRKESVHNWYVFPHSFSPFLIDFLLEKYKNTKQKSYSILDPFSGGATTILRARELGFSGHGIDMLPFAISIGNAKVGIYDKGRINEIASQLLNVDKNERDTTQNEISITQDIFQQDTLNFLLHLRNLVNENEEPYKSFFMTALLSTAEKSISAVKAGGFARKKIESVEKEKSSRSVKQNSLTPSESLAIFDQTIKQMMLSIVDSERYNASSKFCLGDARDADSYDGEFEWLITSPPYPNRQDYTRIFASELLFTYSHTSSDHKTLRYSTLRSHLEAKPSQYIANGYSEVSEIKTIIEMMNENHDNLRKISSKQVRPFDNRISKMIRGYFEDMYLVMDAAKPHLKVGGLACFVVSNVRHAGVAVEVDKILANVGEQVGFELVDILVARERGNSAQQMKIYNRSPSRESVVVFRRV